MSKVQEMNTQGVISLLSFIAQIVALLPGAIASIENAVKSFNSANDDKGRASAVIEGLEQILTAAKTVVE